MRLAGGNLPDTEGAGGERDGRLGPLQGRSRPLPGNRISRRWNAAAGSKAATGAVAAVAAVAVLAALLLAEYSGDFSPHGASAPPETVAVWAMVGGCGSAGGGAAAGAGKWMGRGATGGLMDLELLSNKTLGGDYLYTTVGLASVFRYPAWPAWTAGLSLGWKSATLEYEGYKTGTDDVPALERQAGGFGDLGFSVNRLFGEANSHSLGLSFSLPTGQHDIKRLHKKGLPDDDRRWLNPFAQPGSGLYSAGLTYELTRDKDWGLFVFGASYAASFAWYNWDCRDGESGTVDQKVLACQDERPSPLTWKLWELEHQEWGEGPASWSASRGAPGTGATGADALSLYGYVGRREELSTQSVGLTLSAPFSPTYYWEEGPGGREPNDHRVFTRIRTYDHVLKLSAGVEISHPGFPVFLSVGIPWRLNDVLERGRWVYPMNYIGTLGVKGSFF